MERYSAKQLWQNMISDTGHKSYAVMMLPCHLWSLTGPGYHLFLIIFLGKRAAWTSCLMFYRRKKSYRFRSMSNWWQIFHFWLNCWWQIRNCIWSNYMTTVLSLLLISESRVSEDMDISAAPAPIQDRECISQPCDFLILHCVTFT